MEKIGSGWEDKWNPLKRAVKNRQEKAQKQTSRTEGSEPGFLRVFEIDTRSLAVFRIIIGTLLLVDLAIRASDLGAMYTDEGMFPRAEIARRVTSYWNWSFHFGSGSAGYQWLLFTIAGLLGLGLVAGFQTRWVTVGSWLMLVSIQHRVPPILSGADILMRMLLFWGMFLPLGTRWSVDRWLARGRGQQTNGTSPVISVGSAAILLQMGMMYLFSALFKTNTEWLAGGVIKASLEHDFYAKPLAGWLLQYPGLLTTMTYGVFVLEWIGPMLLFVPWKKGMIRFGAAVALAAMHPGIALCLQVDFFSPVSIAGLALFVPSTVWDWLAAKMGKAGTVAYQVAEARVGRRKPYEYAVQGICAVLLVYVIWVNVRSLPAISGKGTAPKPGLLRTALGLGQKWNMFDEAPAKDGWYVAAATLKDGTQVDLLQGESAINWTRPAHPARVYPNHRWRKLFREMAFEDVLGYQHFRQPVAEFLCRRWNQVHSGGKEISRLQLIYNMQGASREVPGARTTTREKIAEVDFNAS